MITIAFQSLGGLGLFLLGMKNMSEGLQKFAGKKIRRVLSRASKNRLIGCAVGTFVTAIIQSSSATTVMLVGFVDSGLMTLTQAAGIILGANIGTTITAQIIAFKVDALSLPAIALGVFLKFFVTNRKWNYAGDVLIGFGLIFLMILPAAVKASIWLTPRKGRGNGLDELHHIKYLDFKYIQVPSIALAQARAEIIRMAEAVKIMYHDVIRSLKERKLTELSVWRKREGDLDTLQREITHFLVRIMQGQISDEESKDVRSLMRMVNNLERLGDATEEIATMIEDLVERDLYMSEEAVADYEKISAANLQFVLLVLEKMKNEDKEIMPRARELVINIHIMEEDMKASHLERLQKGICQVDTGLIFVNILTSFEKMGGYCYNIAEAVAGLK